MMKSTKKLVTIIAAALLFGLSGAVFATQELDKKVTTVGVDNTESGFFTIEGGTSVTCSPADIIAFDASTVFGKTTYATLLTARAAATNLTEINYHISGSGVCILDVIEL